jgi:hypothetical protein
MHPRRPNGSGDPAIDRAGVWLLAALVGCGSAGTPPHPGPPLEPEEDATPPPPRRDAAGPEAAPADAGDANVADADGTAPADGGDRPGWRLVWSDEFPSR